jgi:hypothetical protein
MKTLPEDRNIDYHHFCVLGEDYAKRKLVTIWRIGDEYLVGDKLDSLPCAASVATVFLSAMGSRKWEEVKDNCRDGEPVWGTWPEK